MKLASYRTVMTFITLSMAVACATTHDERAAAPSLRETYLEKISPPLTEAWNAEVRSQINPLKNATAVQSTPEFSGKVVGFVSADGKIQNVKLVKSSGVKLVDQLAIKAFREASPLPPPPRNLVRKGVAQVPWIFNLKK